MSSILMLLAARLLLAQVASPQLPTDRSVVPQCTTSTDERYAFEKSSPVQVGGGAMYGPARERRYLDALRGPDGQAVRYQRIGSMQAPDGETFLDRYELTYEGVGKPIVLYVDEYHFSDPVAPRGFTCRQPIGLGLPPPDPFTAATALLTTAIEQGGAREFAPIALDGDGTATHGVVFDHFRLVARAARAAAQSGITLNPRTLPRSVAQPRTVVLAYPVSCEGHTVAPVAIEVVSTQGASPEREGDYARDTALGTLLPGMQAPLASLAATFIMSTLRPVDTVRIAYADGTCTGGNATVVLPVKLTPARMIAAPMPTLPAGTTGSVMPLRFQVIVDFEGMFQHPVYIGGPAQLSQPALDAIGQWRAEPQRINGAPIAYPAIVQVTFKQ